jgi:phosphoribosylglycinamide formyltransferase-1
MPQGERTEKKSRVAVLASGRGSNFQAILDAIRSGFLPVRCVALITDNPDAYAITRAKENGVPVRIVDFAAFPGKAEYEAALLSAMDMVDADVYVLAGYMRILGPGIVSRFPGRLINIHPALLPAFPGLHAQRQAVEYGVKVSGCTVHFVNEEMDAGPVILQKCVPVRDGDTEETLADRILEEEHRCLPEAIRLFCQGQISCAGRQVRIRERQG